MSKLEDVLNYWFATSNDYHKWFFSGSLLDNYITVTYKDLLINVINESDISLTPIKLKDQLAKIILVDQFSRHIYRNSKKAYENDGIALNISLELLNNNKIHELTPTEQLFALLPLQHSENILHINTLINFANNKLITCREYDKGVYTSIQEHAKNHRTILELFGRYPKRNAILNRVSTPEECLYIKEFADRVY